MHRYVTFFIIVVRGKKDVNQLFIYLDKNPGYSHEILDILSLDWYSKNVSAERSSLLPAHTGPLGPTVPQAPEQKESGPGPLLLERRREALPGLWEALWEKITRRRARFFVFGRFAGTLY